MLYFKQMKNSLSQMFSMNNVSQRKTSKHIIMLEGNADADDEADAAEKINTQR